MNLQDVCLNILMVAGTVAGVGFLAGLLLIFSAAACGAVKQIKNSAQNRYY